MLEDNATVGAVHQEDVPCDYELMLIKRAYATEKRLAATERRQRDEAWALLREVLMQDWNAHSSVHLLRRIRETLTGRGQ